MNKKEEMFQGKVLFEYVSYVKESDSKGLGVVVDVKINGQLQRNLFIRPGNLSDSVIYSPSEHVGKKDLDSLFQKVSGKFLGKLCLNVVSDGETFIRNPVVGIGIRSLNELVFNHSPPFCKMVVGVLKSIESPSEVILDVFGISIFCFFERNLSWFPSVGQVVGCCGELYVELSVVSERSIGVNNDN